MVLGKEEIRERVVEAIEKFVPVMQVSWSHLSNAGLRKRQGRIFGHTNEETSKNLHSASLGEAKGLGRGCTTWYAAYAVRVEGLRGVWEWGRAVGWLGMPPGSFLRASSPTLKVADCKLQIANCNYV
jgi:hypothetical protein